MIRGNIELAPSGSFHHMSPRDIFKPNDNLNIRGYTLYNHIYQAGDRASGGSSIAVNNIVPQSLIPLNTNLHATAVKVTLHKTIHVCSIYLPPGDRFNIADLEHLITQLPKPFIIMDDLIAIVMCGVVGTQTR